MITKVFMFGLFISTVLSEENSSIKALCTEGVCMPYYLCINGTLNTKGLNLIDKRSVKNSFECESYLDVCCTMTDTEIPPIVTNSGKKVEFEPSLHSSHGSCGHRNIEGIGIASTENGSTAKFGEFPWMAVVMQRKFKARGLTNLYKCGAALIHPQVIMTAAHCVSDELPNSIIVRIGEWDTQTRSESFPHQDRLVSEIVIHGQYNSDALYNDIALLFLNETVDLAEHIKTVCLPPQNFVTDSGNCFVTGWGKDVYGKEGKYQEVMKKIELAIILKQPCLAALRNTRLGFDFILHHSFICAGAEYGKDACVGDGGSPLVCPIPGTGTESRYYQAGIVSWGIGCGNVNTPGVYANVPNFRSWIDEQLQVRRLNSSYYSP